MSWMYLKYLKNIYSSTNWYTFQGQGHLVSTWNYDMHVNVHHLILDTQFEPLSTNTSLLWCDFCRLWSRHHVIREPHMDARICLPGTLTDSGSPARLVSGVPVCLYHHCRGKPPHHGHSDLWFQAPHTHVFSAAKSGCHRPLFLLSHCPEDAGRLPLWEEDHLLPGLHGPDLLLPLSGRCHGLLPLSDGLWPPGCHLPAPPLCHHHEHSGLCWAGVRQLGGRLHPFHFPTGSDAPSAFLWPQHLR